MTGITLLAAAAFAWLLTPFLSGALVVCFDRSRAAVARHLRLCLAAGWLGLAEVAWGATSLDTGAGEVVFLVGGHLAGSASGRTARVTTVPGMIPRRTTMAARWSGTGSASSAT